MNNIEYIRIANNNLNDVISFLNERGNNISINDIFKSVDGYYIDAKNNIIYKIDDVIIYHCDTKQFETMSFDEYKDMYYDQVEYLNNRKTIFCEVYANENDTPEINDKYKLQYEIEDYFLNF